MQIFAINNDVAQLNVNDFEKKVGGDVWYDRQNI